MSFEKLYEVSDRCQVHFIGYASEHTRYDYAIVFTEQFFGKPLVISMQNGRSGVIGQEDLDDLDYLQRVFLVENQQRTAELSDFLGEQLPGLMMQDQYE